MRELLGGALDSVQKTYKKLLLKIINVTDIVV